MLNYLKALVSRLVMLFCRLVPMKEDKIVFKSDRGQQSTDSPLALYKTMQKMYPTLDYVWILKDPSKSIEGARTVKHGSFKEIFELATARIWIDNKRKGLWTVKRKHQIYVQTWHGPIALKKIEKDVEEKLPSYYVKSAKHDSKVCDYFLSSCAWATNFYLNSFWYDGNVLEYGVPRSDVFYQDNSDIKKSVYDYYGLDEKVKLVLYAPTFRDGDSLSCYDIDMERLIHSLSLKFGGQWKVILRLHPNLLADQSKIQYSKNVLNGNGISEISYLIVASEMLITDYSSCMFDAMEAGKIVLLYATDVDHYRNYERGFYFDLDDLPFPIGEDNESFIKLIEQFDYKAYQKNVSEFMDSLEFFNSAHSSELISKYLIEK